MLKHIRIVPLAAESLGVRSMCTFVETSNVKILLDAGVSLCPERFGLPPHPMEFRAIDDARRKIAVAAEMANVITLSHYHFDHHTPSFEDWLCNWTVRHETAKQIYQGKTVLTKNPKECINFSQRRRGWMFQRTGGKHAKKLITADGKTFAFGDTEIRFSRPVFHGPENSALGWVLMTTIQHHEEKFMFAPDVQGPMSTSTLKLIFDEKPMVLMIGGPPTYLAALKVDDKEILVGLENLAKIVKAIPCVILEHHILRDENWLEKTKAILDKACQVNCRVLTAAEYLGRENLFLEALRKRLFEVDSPAKDFQKWMQASREAKMRVKPPF